MPIRISSLDPNTAFSEMCETLVVNLHGAGVRSPAAGAIATTVHLETGDHRTATGWITDFEPLGRDAKWWLLGIALEQPTNFWGVPKPPDDWIEPLPQVAPPTPQSPERKFSVWPGAYGPQPAHRQAPALVEVAHPSPRQPSDPAALFARLQADLERRTEEYWTNFRSEIEPRLLESTSGLQQELHDSLAAWRAERTIVEGKLQELLAVRDEVAARLGSITGLLREQSAPLREEIIAEARAQVDKLISDFQERLRGERQAAGTAQHPLTNAAEEQFQRKTDTLLQQFRDRSTKEIAGLASTAMDRLEHQLKANLGQAAEKIHQELSTELQQRQQAASQSVAGHMEDLRTSEVALRDRVRQLREELSTQSEHALARLRVQVQELGDKQEQELADRLKKRDAASQAALQTLGGSILMSAKQQLQAELERQQQEQAGSYPSLRAGVERLERHAADLESRLDEVRQAREYVESLFKTLPEMIQQRVSESVAAAIEQMSGPAQDQFTMRVQSEITALERQVHEIAGQVGASLRGELAADLAQRDQQWQSTLTASLSELQAQAAAIREEAGRIGRNFEQQRETLLDSANTKLRELAERDSTVRQTFQAITAGLDSKKEEILAAAQSGLEQTRAGETHLRQAADEANAGLAARTQQSLESLKTSLQATVSEREQQLQHLVAESQKQAEALLQQRTAAASAALQEQLQQEFERRQQAFDQARASAVGRLESLDERADQLTSLVDVELQKRAEGFVNEVVSDATLRLDAAGEKLRQANLARAQAEMDTLLDEKLKTDADELLTKAVAGAAEQLQAQANSARREQLARTQAELDRLLGGVVQQAADAGSELRRAIEALQQGFAQTRMDSAEIHSKVEQAQACLARQTEQFHKTLHDAFLEAAGEIKGRVRQAVEMAEEPIDRRSREIQSKMDAVAQQKAGELRLLFDEARDRLQTSAKASEVEVEGALQEQLAQALQTFREHAEKLAKNSMERWQAAIGETLTELPRMLTEKFGIEDH
ncbi:MAG: hypothetical protein LAN64_15710 [Acidobacteriia bacterium]|nr:hypothetical protein [Terriglobia bacterium]